MMEAMQRILFGIVCVSISQLTWAREETWQMTVWPAPWDVEYKSTWLINISDAGEVTGVSTWDANDATGTSNTIDGHISKNGELTLVRHLAGKNAGQTQEYSGSYSSDGHTTEGNTTGYDSPGSWVATVTVDHK